MDNVGSATRGTKRRCLGLVSSPLVNTEPDVDIGQRQEHEALRRTINHRNSKHRQRFSIHEQSASISSCREFLVSMSGQRRESLCAAFRTYFNSYVPILSEDQTMEILNQQLKYEDYSVLLHIAVLATGLLYANEAEQEPWSLQSSAGRRSALHQALKEAVELCTFPEDNIDQLPILLLLSELERSAGYTGSANLYLNEASRIATITVVPSNYVDMSLTDEEVLRRRSYIRACDFLLRQWSLFGGHGYHVHPAFADSTGSAGQRSANRLVESDLEKSTYLASHEFLRLASSSMRKLQALGHYQTDPTHEQLRRWYTSLPDFLSLESSRRNWPMSLYFLHVQYLACQLLVCVGTADWEDAISPSHNFSEPHQSSCAKCHDYAVQVVNILAEFNQEIQVSKAPLIVAYHAELAAAVLLDDITPSLEVGGGPSESAEFQVLNQTLERTASCHLAAISLAQDVHSRLQQFDGNHYHSGQSIGGDTAEMFEYDGMNSVWHNLSTSALGDAGPADALPATDSHDPTELLGTTDILGQQNQAPKESSAYMSSPPSPPLPSRSEERLVLISDPVFCAYVDEMTYIVGQYNSPPVDVELQQNLGVENGMSCRALPSKDAIKQLRLHLGHDPPHSDYEQSWPYTLERHITDTTNDIESTNLQFPRPLCI